MRANDSQTTKTRHVVVQVECRLDEGTLANFPGVEFYHADGPDTENQTDMALLNDLEMPIKLAFVGGDEARRLAELYGGRWVEDVRTADSSFWGEFRQVTRRAQDSGG